MKPSNQRNRIQVVLQRLSMLTAIMIHIHNVQFINSDDQVYQPTKQEIERFQVIQEQIRHHQQEEQNEKRKNQEKITFLQEQQRRQDQETERQLRQQENMMMIEPRHPAESLLIPHSALVPMFVHKQQQYSDHRVPMPPQIIHPPPPPPPPPTGLIDPMVNHPQSHHFHHQQFVPHSPVLIPQTPSVPEAMNINYNNHHPFVGDRIRQIDNNNNNNNIALNHLNRNSGQSIDATVRQPTGRHQAKNSPLQRHHHHHHHPERDDDSDAEHHDSELSESSRFDKNHPGPGEEGRYGRYRFRCYSCHWDIAKCSDFNCYNNPDICTTNNFQPHLVQQADCTGGCEEFVITDPNGLTQQWKRGCAQPASLPITRMRCQTFYEFGVRIDRCVCNSDWCNGGVLSTLAGQQSVQQVMVWVAITVSSIIITSIISS